MKKIIFALLTAVITLTSCMSYTYAQSDEIYASEEENNITVVIRYGTPYYLDGTLLYYLYDGWYYYPYYHNNYWYYYRYMRPLPYHTIRHGFIPPYGHKPYYHGNVRPRFHDRGFGSKHRRYDNARPRNDHNRGSLSPRNDRGGRSVGFGKNRPSERKIAPNNARRSSTYQTTPRTTSPSISRQGNFGGARPSGTFRPTPSRPSAAPRTTPSGGNRGFGGRR